MQTAINNEKASSDRPSVLPIDFAFRNIGIGLTTIFPAVL